MDAFQLQGHSLDSLRRLDLPEPQPGPGQVRVRVAAASINYRDYALATGRYQPELPRPFVPLSDGVGRIDALGAGVADFAVGERVIGHYTTAWREGPFKSENHLSKLGGPLDGWLARSIVLPADAIARAPRFLDDAEASTLPVSGLTAWTALRKLQLQPGAKLLVQGTGSVSLMALQLAAARGVEVIATTGDAGKAELLRSLGARAVVDYRQRADLSAAVRELTGGRGVDGIVDVVGGQQFLQLLQAAADNAHIAVIGFLQSMNVDGNVIGPIMARQLNIHGVSVGSLQDLRAYLDEVEAHRIRPVVGARFSFEDGARAIASIAEERQVGKPVVIFD
ncbi:MULTISPECIES: NAD(P)-dependent alcohol dehydrogenase [unclassified Lysobacter]|uniref:zinc-dependent alcohol dehydrogenase family protein n=1 Tax=unclassified Lysobacter TaxID=2635362 RepID=UPI001BE9386A|nr:MULTISPECIES: NAD(P)-dependent alcohol dehydrogenase [unclassified Lysobacter]MBT2746313.1 NAD(P)-dependent alcohol dehydrogenase [Lysobacter sp. ISL-42]MBT2751214.1 NAD(P)-dependent alcohol dehydrogenase [Lysobacter sp. ISL-50]MBT2775622.1 NAD(P)-dependent alcohol dehydrogenase [Lysobacter sp. ISL-54]MBT2780007.1 NAD(P)-dependent alcohol dehydrogenase [Lysobacter sp. ISL-52]